MAMIESEAFVGYMRLLYCTGCEKYWERCCDCGIERIIREVKDYADMRECNTKQTLVEGAGVGGEQNAK